MENRKNILMQKKTKEEKKEKQIYIANTYISELFRCVTSPFPSNQISTITDEDNPIKALMEACMGEYNHKQLCKQKRLNRRI